MECDCVSDDDDDDEQVVVEVDAVLKEMIGVEREVVDEEGYCDTEDDEDVDLKLFTFVSLVYHI